VLLAAEEDSGEIVVLDVDVGRPSPITEGAGWPGWRTCVVG
jgi:hypothetical protein